MALNIDNSNNEEEANIIHSPVINKSKDLYIEKEYKLGQIEKEFDNFGDISGINKENNDEINDNSLILINKYISKDIIPKKKIIPNLEKKIKNFFENSKINELISSEKENLNLKINHTNNIYGNNRQIMNNNEIVYKLNFQNIKVNNEKKYNLLFNENKKLDINTLREEYTKLKSDNNLIYNNQNENYNKQKKYIGIFYNNFTSKNSDNISINFDKFIINNQKRYINSYKKFNYNFKYYFKTNNNSKEKNNDKLNKYQIIKNELFKEKPSSSIFNINNYINRNIKNVPKNSIFNSLRNLNESFNSKEDNDSWLMYSNNINSNFNKKIKIYNSQNNLEFKNYSKNNSIFNILKLNRNNAKNQDFKFEIPKSNFLDFKNIKELNKNKKDLDNVIDRYNNKRNNFYYNLTGEENKNDNYFSLKKRKIFFNKIEERNDNTLDKYTNNFDEIFYFVENKIKNKGNNINNSSLKEFDSRYHRKQNFKKINPKLLSISQNEPKKNDLLKFFKKINEKNNFNLEHKNKLNIKISAQNHPLKRKIKKDIFSNSGLPNYSYNDADNFIMKNKRKILLNL